ncbi:MAG: sulfotransferase family protein [Pseudomonadota bacterium]
MHPIRVLWATPRSTSTAFEWMMRMRGDMACFHEPFGEAWYQGDDAMWPRLETDSPRQPGLNYDTVLARLTAAAEKRPVFSKDMPQFTDHLWTDEFLNTFQHSFLIRDPSKVLTSVHRNWPHFVMREIGFVELRDLFDRISDRQGGPAPVIDSDDLLEDPHSIVEAYSNAMGFPFIPEALSWEPGARDEVLWYDEKGVWHENLMKSDGLKPQPRKAGSIESAPDWVKEMYDVCLPVYEHMHQHRLQA